MQARIVQNGVIGKALTVINLAAWAKMCAESLDIKMFSVLKVSVSKLEIEIDLSLSPAVNNLFYFSNLVIK